MSNAKAEPAVQLPVDLRDYFAAKVMAVLLHALADAGKSDEAVIATIPVAAYQMADAMLEARKT